MVQDWSKPDEADSRQFQSDSHHQLSRFKHRLLVAAYLVFAGVSLLLTALGVVTLSAAVLPSGPLGIVLIITVGLGLMAAAPTLARWIFITGLDAVEGSLMTPTTDEVFQPAYDEVTAIGLQVIALHDAGHSDRAIEAATGVSKETIRTIVARREEYLTAAKKS